MLDPHASHILVKVVLDFLIVTKQTVCDKQLVVFDVVGREIAMFVLRFIIYGGCRKSSLWIEYMHEF